MIMIIMIYVINVFILGLNLYLFIEIFINFIMVIMVVMSMLINLIGLDVKELVIVIIEVECFMIIKTLYIIIQIIL